MVNTCATTDRLETLKIDNLHVCQQQLFIVQCYGSHFEEVPCRPNESQDITVPFLFDSIFSNWG